MLTKLGFKYIYNQFTSLYMSTVAELGFNQLRTVGDTRGQPPCPVPPVSFRPRHSSATKPKAMSGGFGAGDIWGEAPGDAPGPWCFRWEVSIVMGVPEKLVG